MYYSVSLASIAEDEFEKLAKHLSCSRAWSSCICSWQVHRRQLQQWIHSCTLSFFLGTIAWNGLGDDGWLTVLDDTIAWPCMIGFLVHVCLACLACLCMLAALDRGGPLP